MYRIDNATAGTILPAPTPAGTPGFFTTGNIGGQLATIVSADFMNGVQEELIAILAAAAIAPDKTVNNQVLTAILALIAGNTRKKLTAATTIYISPTGNDANDGLTSATALLTGQAAWNLLLGWDLNLHNVTIQFAHGTYSTPLVCSGAPLGLSSNTITFLGDTASPSSVVLAVSSSPATITAIQNSSVVISGMTLTNTFAGTGFCIECGAGAGVVLGPGMVFGPATSAHLCATGGGAEINGNGVSYTITGSAANHLNASEGGMVAVTSCAVTLSGSPNFSNCFCVSESGSLVVSNSCTFTGAATGMRYDVSTNSLIDTSGSGASYFPGSVAGTTESATYGVYR
jgi:hypothetical protein